MKIGTLISSILMFLATAVQIVISIIYFTSSAADLTNTLPILGPVFGILYVIWLFFYITLITTKKKTLPILYGLEESSILQALYAQEQTSGQFVQQVVTLLNEHDARDFASEKASAYSQSALSNLEAAQPTGEATIALNQLTEMLLTRNF